LKLSVAAVIKVARISLSIIIPTMDMEIVIYSPVMLIFTFILDAVPVL